MSSFKNAKKSLQRTHKERNQPAKRKHFGLLEKHKDYVLRAKDYHRKEDHLKLLREKARNKNPDEFYYKMINTKTRDGVHIVQKGKEYSSDQLKIMKSQDLNYARMKRTTERKKIEKLRNSLNFVGGEKDKPVNSRVIFVDSKKEIDTFNPFPILNKSPTESAGQMGLEKTRKKAYNELEKRIDREKQLTVIEQQMQLQKHLMGKGSRMKIKSGEDGSVVYKWRKQRKK